MQDRDLRVGLLPYMVLPSGKTIGDEIIPRLADVTVSRQSGFTWFCAMITFDLRIDLNLDTRQFECRVKRNGECLGTGRNWKEVAAILRRFRLEFAPPE